MEELKSVLDNLNAALFELQKKIAEVDKEKESLAVNKIKQGELSAKLEAKTKDLDVREGAVKHIESIVDYTAQAKKLMAEAQDLMVNAEEKQKKLDAGFKQLAEDRTKLMTEVNAGNVENKKQADALRQEKKEFEAKIEAFKTVQGAVNAAMRVASK